MSIKAIGFDWGGVLCGRPSAVFNEGFAAFADVSVQEFENAYFTHADKLSSQKLSQEQLWALVLNDLHRSDLIPNVHSAVAELNESNILNQDIFKLVDRLRKNGYKTGLLSNNTQEFADKARADGISEHFDSFIVSAEVGYRKPDPEIFKMFTAELKVDANELVFIDDSAKSLSTADISGYKPILFKNYADLVVELNNLEVKFEVRP